MKWLFFWFLVVAAIGGAWAWFIPPTDPLDYLQYRFEHKAGDTVEVTTAQADALCPRDMIYFRAPCVEQLIHPHFAMFESHTRFLAEVQSIPRADCAHMTQALEERQHLNDDGRVVKNARGGFNCDFSRYGLTHIDWHSTALMTCALNSAAAAVAMSAHDYDHCSRTVYVTRPVYNLSRTRFSIEVGDSTGGERCIYTRLNGWHLMDHWALEKCPQSWTF